MQLTKLLLAGSCRLLCASLPRSLRECTSARAKYKLCRLLLGQSIDRQSARVKLIVVFPARMCSIFNIRSTRVTYIAQISAPCPRPPIQVSEVILLFFLFSQFHNLRALTRFFLLGRQQTVSLDRLRSPV